LVMIMGEPDINRKEWIDYRNRFQPLVGFEIAEKWEHHTFDDYEKYFCMHTYVYDILGACVRMIEFACELQVAVIDFIGMDGVEAIEKGEHAFQPGKTTLPSLLANYTGRNIRASSMTSSTIFKAKYNIFWERMKKNHPHTSFHNLGGGEKYHKAIMHSHSS